MEKNTKLYTIQPFATKVLAIIFKNMHLSHVQKLLLDNLAETIPIKALQNLAEQYEKSLLNEISLSLQKNTEFKWNMSQKFCLRILIDYYRTQHTSVNYLDKDILNLLANDYLKENEQVIIENYLNPWRANKLEDFKKVEFEKMLVKCLKTISQRLSNFIKCSTEKRDHELYHELTTQAEKYQMDLFIETVQTLIAENTEALIAAIPQLKDYYAEVQIQLIPDLSFKASISSKASCEYLTEVIYKTADDHSDNIAIEEWDPSEGKYKSHTYQELKKRSNELATWLSRKISSAGAIVGLFLEPSFDYVCCQLAVLKANLTFVPLDPYQGVGLERLKGIITTCDPAIILTHAALQNHTFSTYCKDSEFTHKTYDVGTLINNIEPSWKQDKTNSKQRAYVIFTSGSTGNPKGIEISHAGIMPMVRGLASAMGIIKEDCMAQYAQLGFDMSLAEIWVPLCYGAKLKIIPLAERLNYAKLPYYFEGVTVAMLTPTVLRHFADKLNKPVFKKLKYVISAGEKGDLKLFKNCVDNHPGCLTIRNGYGPAECTVATTMCADDNHRDTLHIGEPLAGYTLFLLSLDKDEQPHIEIDSNHLKQFCEAQCGTLYELAIGGVGVGIGYFNNPGLTQKRFLTLDHPLTGEPIKIFRTYDGVKVTPTTSKPLLTVEKRLDRAIKPYGMIIYPEDIENVLKEANSNIKKVYVEAKLTEKGHPEITAYLELNVETQLVNYVELFDYVRQKLSLTHAPRGWAVTKFETSTSHKTKVSLQPLEYIRGLDHYYPIADQKIEQLRSNLQDLWRQILEFPGFEFYLNDKFFRLGGTSIRCQELIGSLRVKKEFNVKLMSTEISNNLTFGHMLRLIRRQKNKINVELIPLHIEEESKEKANRLFLLHTLTGDAESDYTLTDSYSTGSNNKTFISQLIDDMSNKHIACDLYGISAVSLSEKHHPIDMPTTIQEIASLYLVAIKKKQRKGPYYLIGWSAGGYIAYEIARQLRKNNELAAVFMLDTAHPCYRQDMSLEIFAEHLKQTARTFFLKLLGLSLPNHYKEIDDLVLTDKPKHQQIDELFKSLYHFVKEDPSKQRKLATWSSMFHAILDYQIEEILPFVHLFIARNTNKERGLNNLGWQQNFYRTITLKANHTSIIIKEEHRKLLTSALAEHIANFQSYGYLKPIIDSLRKKYQVQKLNLKKMIIPITLEKVNAFITEQINGNDLLDLYHHDEVKIKNILVIGEKGSGKTYLKRNLLYQWAEQSNESSFVLVIPISLRKFSDEKLKEINENEMLAHVLKEALKTALIQSTDLDPKLFEAPASEFMIHLNRLAPHILIMLDDHTKILYEGYEKIKIFIKNLVKKTIFNVILFTDTYNVPPIVFGKDHLRLRIASWDQTKIYQFIQARYSEEKLLQYKEFCNLHPNFSLSCYTPPFIEILIERFSSLDIKDRNFSNNLVYLLQNYEDSQWRKYLERIEIQEIKRNQGVIINTSNVGERYGLLDLRRICDTEFKFLVDLSEKSKIKNKINFVYHELETSSENIIKGSSGSKITFDAPLEAALQLGFIYIKDSDHNTFVFRYEIMRDYFYAIRWVERWAKTEGKDKNDAQAQWEVYRWDPQFRQVWMLVAGMLANDSSKEDVGKLKEFFDNLISKSKYNRPLGFYQYLLLIDCYREAKDKLSDESKKIIIEKVANLLQWHLERLSHNTYYEESVYKFITTLKRNSFLLYEETVEILLITALSSNSGRIPPFLWVLELLQLRTTLSSRIEEALLNILKDPKQCTFLRNTLRLYLKDEQRYSTKIKFFSYSKLDETPVYNIVIKQIFRPLLNLIKMTEKGRQYIENVAKLEDGSEIHLESIKNLLPWILTDTAMISNDNTIALDAKSQKLVEACIEIAKKVQDQKNTESNQTNLVGSYYQVLYSSNPVLEKLNNLNKEDYKMHFNTLMIEKIKQLPMDQANYRDILFNIIKDSHADIRNPEYTSFNKAKILILEYVAEAKRKGVEALLIAICKIYMDDPNQKIPEFHLELLQDILDPEPLVSSKLNALKLNAFINDKLLKHLKDNVPEEFDQYISILSTVDFKNHLVTLELSADLNEKAVEELFKSTTCSLKALYDYWNDKNYDVNRLIPLFVSWIKQRNIMMWLSENEIVIVEPGSAEPQEILKISAKNKGFYVLLEGSCEPYLTAYQLSSTSKVEQDKKLIKPEKKNIKQEQKLREVKTETTLEIIKHDQKVFKKANFLLEMINRVSVKAGKQIKKVEESLKEDDERMAEREKTLKEMTAKSSCILPNLSINREEDDEDQGDIKTLITAFNYSKDMCKK